MQGESFEAFEAHVVTVTAVACLGVTLVAGFVAGYLACQTGRTAEPVLALRTE